MTREVIDNSVTDFSADSLWGKKKTALETIEKESVCELEVTSEAEPEADESVVVGVSDKDDEEYRKLLRRKVWWKVKPVIGAIVFIVAIAALTVVATALLNQMSVLESAQFWAEKLASQWRIITGAAR